MVLIEGCSCEMLEIKLSQSERTYVMDVHV